MGIVERIELPEYTDKIGGYLRCAGRLAIDLRSLDLKKSIFRTES